MSRRRAWVLFAALLAGALLFGVGCSERGTPIAQVDPLPGLKVRALTDRTFERTPERRARGEYLVQGILQCFICHSERDWDAPGAPPKPGREGAGVVWRDDGATRLVAPNLTPDPETGAGRWTDDMLARAIREGIGHDGRLLHGQMWYSSFRVLADEDLAAVIVYLRSIPPIRNPLPRTVLSAEQIAEHVRGPQPITNPVPPPPQATPVERGRYLVRLADCVGCHTSWYSARQPGELAGGNFIEDWDRQAFSTNITPDPSGVAYDAESFIAIIRTGRGGLTNPLMPWTVFRHLSDEDLAAIHAYLQTRPAQAHFISNLVAPQACAVCGQKHGLGELNHIALPQSAAVDAAVLRAYVGRYRSEEYDWSIAIELQGGSLVARDGDVVTPLYPQSTTTFRAPGMLAPLRFERDSSGKAVAVVSEQIEAIRLERVVASPR